jgi:hypothetical protein
MWGPESGVEQVHRLQGIWTQADASCPAGRGKGVELSQAQAAVTTTFHLHDTCLPEPGSGPLSVGSACSNQNSSGPDRKSKASACGVVGKSLTVCSVQEGRAGAWDSEPWASSPRSYSQAAYVTLQTSPPRPSPRVNFTVCSCPTGCSEHQMR